MIIEKRHDKRCASLIWSLIFNCQFSILDEKVPGRLMAGQRPLEPLIQVRVLARQQRSAGLILHSY